MRGKARSGIGIAGTLVICALVVMASLAVSGASFFHLNLASRQSNEAIAQNLAESAVSRVIERVLAQEKTSHELDYGEDNSATVEVSFDDAPPGALGLASFDPHYAGAHHLNFSPCINNLRSDSAIAAPNGTVIPRESLYVVGYGSCAGVERRVEAVIAVPRFPYSIACQGSFVGSDLLVAGIDAATQVRAGTAVPEEDLKPGHLVSNSSLGREAVHLTGSNRLKGNLQSASGAHLGPNTLVEGQLLLHAPAAEIPTIDLENYRPDLHDPSVDQGLTSLERDLHLDRTAYFAGSQMTVLDGLNLDGGVLFVDGDLTIQGGVSGIGAVIATGNLTIHGSGSVASDNVAAILAGGFLDLEGSSGTQAKDAVVEGLLYSGKRIAANNITLVGTMISAGDEPSEFHNSILLGNDEHAEVTVSRRRVTPGSVVIGPYQLKLIQAGIPGYTDTLPMVDYLITTEDEATDHSGVRYFAEWDADAVVAALESRLGRPITAAERQSILPLMLGQMGPQYQQIVQAVVGKNDDGSDKMGPVRTSQLAIAVVDTTETTDEQTVIIGGSSTTEDRQTIFSIDIADFVAPADRMRVRWWRGPKA